MERQRTNKEIGEAVARNIAKWNEATRVENKPSEQPMSYVERVIAARKWAAEKEAKIAEYMQKK